MPWTIEYTETALTQLRKLDKRTARRIVASSMNAKQLLTHFDRLADAPDAIPRLRRFILDLAVRGKLVEQDPEDEPASELLKRIAAEKKAAGGRRGRFGNKSGFPPVDEGDLIRFQTLELVTSATSDLAVHATNAFTLH